MSNALIKGGKPWNSPLIGNGGAIKTINVINPMPKTVKDIVNNYLQDVPVSRIKSLPGQRDTDVKAIEKILKARGGIDGRVFRQPRGAIIKGDPTKTVYVYDGDHTRHLWMAAYPNERTMPMHVIMVNSLAEVNALFVNCNDTGKTKITKEEKFVNEFHSGNADAKKKELFAKNIGLYVHCSHESGGRVGDTTGYSVKVNTVNKLMNACQQNPVSAKEAVNLVSSMANFEKAKPIPLHLTLALTMLNEAFPSLVGNKKRQFQAWFKGFTSNLQLNDVVALAQNQCGQAAIGSQNTLYVAIGLLKLLKQQKITGLQSFRVSTLQKKFS